jgi:2-polyprenyl-6-methoxyphenol hydroxylase-like FAD-dependent oxidoreductase
MSIGIVGAGISGLHLALRLQREGVETVVYAPRTAQDLREGRLLNTVARFAGARERERELDVDHWLHAEWQHVHMSVTGTPIAFTGQLGAPSSTVDFRVYLAQLLEDYARRGGEVVVEKATAESIDERSRDHALMVLGAGGRDTSGLLTRDPARSPYEAPQRRLCAALFDGVRPAEPAGLTYVIVPEGGEIFQVPFHTVHGPGGGNILIEAIPGGPLEAVTQMAYDEDPDGFVTAVRELLERVAPPIAERIDRDAFGLRSGLDILQGAITPTVRRPYTQLPSGRMLIGVGDAWVINDPVVGQGANLGSRAAWLLADAILEDRVYDEWFCHVASERMWAAAEPVTNFCNAFLQPPPPHIIDLLGAASQDQAVADALTQGFEHPDRMWRMISSPQRAAATLAAVGAPAPAA